MAFVWHPISPLPVVEIALLPQVKKKSSLGFTTRELTMTDGKSTPTNGPLPRIGFNLKPNDAEAIKKSGWAASMRDLEINAKFGFRLRWCSNVNDPVFPLYI